MTTTTAASSLVASLRAWQGTLPSMACRAVVVPAVIVERVIVWGAIGVVLGADYAIGRCCSTVDAGADAALRPGPDDFTGYWDNHHQRT